MAVVGAAAEMATKAARKAVGLEEVSPELEESDQVVAVEQRVAQAE